MATESVMDVVNAALAGENTIKPLDEETEVTTGDEEAGGEEETTEEGGEEEGTEGGEEEGGEEGGEEDTSGVATPDVAKEAAELGLSVRDANGRFKSKDALAKEVAEAKAAAAAGKPVEKKPDEKKVAKKEPDALNDPIPKELKVETQQRIQTLITRTRESEEKAAKFENDFNFLVKGVESTGATPEQYGETLSWLALFNSADPKNKEKALELVESVADRLATMLGKERTISDPLLAHPDLQAAVNAKQITPALAKEIARGRNQGAFTKELQTQATTQQQMQQQAQQEKETARTDLNTLETQLQASDAQYEQKKAILLPTLKVLFPSLRPSQWKDAFLKAYREVKIAPAPVVRKTPAQQPMRAKGGSGPSGGGDMKTQPKSGLDALNAALSSMNK